MGVQPAGSADILLPPQGKIKKIPDLGALLPLEQLHDFGRVQEISLLAKLHELLPRISSQSIQKPFVYGNAEALFLPVNQFVRDDSPHRLLQDIFECPISELNRRGYSHREFNKLVI